MTHPRTFTFTDFNGRQVTIPLTKVLYIRHGTERVYDDGAVVLEGGPEIRFQSQSTVRRLQDALEQVIAIDAAESA